MSGSGPTLAWDWGVERGPADQLHAASARRAARPCGRSVRLLEATGPAVVLGSAQPTSAFDPDRLHRAGLALARRRSGGSAVLVGPGEVCWVDLIVPAGDPLWSPDVGRAAWWVGDLWAEALAATGVTGAEVWRGGFEGGPASRLVCFAGLGPGEVRIGGRKVVGVAQRRTREAALFQTALLLRWDPARVLDVAALDEDQRRADRAALAPLAMGVGAQLGGEVVEALTGLLRAPVRGGRQAPA